MNNNNSNVAKKNDQEKNGGEGTVKRRKGRVQQKIAYIQEETAHRLTNDEIYQLLKAHDFLVNNTIDSIKQRYGTVPKSTKPSWSSVVSQASPRGPTPSRGPPTSQPSPSEVAPPPTQKGGGGGGGEGGRKRGSRGKPTPQKGGKVSPPRGISPRGPTEARIVPPTRRKEETFNADAKIMELSEQLASQLQQMEMKQEMLRQFQMEIHSISSERDNAIALLTDEKNALITEQRLIQEKLLAINRRLGVIDSDVARLQREKQDKVRLLEEKSRAIFSNP
jgi:hypothetical protein